jgi:HAD superfamily hydrolase (TIGR01509 family)
MSSTTEDNLFAAKTTVIFDFDGTIANTLHLHEAAFKEALAGYTLTYRYSDYAGMSTRKAISLIFSANQQQLTDDQLLALTKKKQWAANALYRQAIDFMPGAELLIHLLYDKKFRLFVASSGSHMNVHAGLEALGILHLFAGVITADDVQQAKPHPEIFLKILEQYKIPAMQVIIIEDALSGLQAAAAAGIDAVCIDGALTCEGSGLSFVTATMFQLKEQLSK